MFAKRFALAKYPEEAGLNGQIVTWDNPETMQELQQLGRWENEAAIVASAVAYTDVQCGHAIRRAYDKAIKEGKTFTLADAQAVADSFKQSVPRRKGSSGRKAKQQQKIAEASLEKLNMLLGDGFITQKVYDDELARRAGASKAKAKAAK